MLQSKNEAFQSRCYQNTKHVKDKAQNFFFDQNRIEVLVKAAFLLPLPGKRKLVPALAIFLGALRALAVPFLQDHGSYTRRARLRLRLEKW
jgi:hypothetical protein